MNEEDKIEIINKLSTEIVKKDKKIKFYEELIKRIEEEIKLLPVSQTYTETFVEEIINVMILERMVRWELKK